MQYCIIIPILDIIRGRSLCVFLCGTVQKFLKAIVNSFYYISDKCQHEVFCMPNFWGHLESVHLFPQNLIGMKMTQIWLVFYLLKLQCKTSIYTLAVIGNLKSFSLYPIYIIFKYIHSFSFVSILNLLLQITLKSILTLYSLTVLLVN